MRGDFDLVGCSAFGGRSALCCFAQVEQGVVGFAAVANDRKKYLAVLLLLDKANAAGKPVFGSEIEQVKLGCVAAEGLDYIALGRQTGLMAAKVLKGEAKASEIPYEIITEPGLYVNTEALAKFGIVLSDELKARANGGE